MADCYYLSDNPDYILASAIIKLALPLTNLIPITSKELISTTVSSSEDIIALGKISGEKGLAWQVWEKFKDTKELAIIPEETHQFPVPVIVQFINDYTVGSKIFGSCVFHLAKYIQTLNPNDIEKWKSLFYDLEELKNKIGIGKELCNGTIN